MKLLKVTGGAKLSGSIDIQGSKNAALPILAASILTNETVVIRNCPKISDVEDMLRALKHIGCEVKRTDDALYLTTNKIKTTELPAELTNYTRASVLLLGAMIGRANCVSMSYPGGCNIGTRPIDMHLSGIKQLGVQIIEWEDRFEAFVLKNHYIGDEIELRYPSVGATENILIAAVCASGTTIIRGAAKEPEVSALADFLVAMGADITGIGSRELVINGVPMMHGTEFKICGDRIAAGTYAFAALATGGTIKIRGLRAADLAGQYLIMSKIDAKMSLTSGVWSVEAPQKLKTPEPVITGPFPAFPTDLQSPMLAAMLRAEGNTAIIEKVFSDRFRIIPELIKLGADVADSGEIAVIRGVNTLKACELCGYELRGAAGLVIAALQAEGTSVIKGMNFIERGYEDICGTLRQLGADIELTEE